MMPTNRMRWDLRVTLETVPVDLGYYSLFGSFVKSYF